MNVLDENILLSQRTQLRARKVHFRQIGMEIVVRVRHSGVSYWQLRERKERIVSW